MLLQINFALINRKVKILLFNGHIDTSLTKVSYDLLLNICAFYYASIIETLVEIFKARD